MDENIRFIQVLDDLKKQGIISDYVQAANELGTNKAGISDIKSGRKKLSIEMLRRMKKSYREINVEWIVMGEGEMYITESSRVPNNPDVQFFIDKMTKQAEEIGGLRERVRQLEQELKKPASPVENSMVASAG